MDRVSVGSEQFAGAGTRPPPRSSTRLRQSPIQPPPATTAIPPTIGPSTFAALCDVARTALARNKASGATNWGMIPRLAGNVRAAAAPLMASSRISAGTGAVSVSRRAATVPCERATPVFAPINSRARGHLSARTPPNRKQASIVTLYAARTAAKSLALPVDSSTAKESATAAIPLPTSDTTWPT